MPARSPAPPSSENLESTRIRRQGASPRAWSGRALRGCGELQHRAADVREITQFPERARKSAGLPAATSRSEKLGINSFGLGERRQHIRDRAKGKLVDRVRPRLQQRRGHVREITGLAEDGRFPTGPAGATSRSAKLGINSISPGAWRQHSCDRVKGKLFDRDRARLQHPAPGVRETIHFA